MTDIRETLNRIAQRADMATPGPWEATCSDFGHSRTDSECSVITSDVGDIVCDMRSVDRLDLNERYRDEGVVDAAFIAMARTDVPKLLAALRAVLDLHGRRPCKGCTDEGACSGICVKCGSLYPCADVRAISEALGGDA